MAAKVSEAIAAVDGGQDALRAYLAKLSKTEIVDMCSALEHILMWVRAEWAVKAQLESIAAQFQAASGGHTAVRIEDMTVGSMLRDAVSNSIKFTCKYEKKEET